MSNGKEEGRKKRRGKCLVYHEAAFLYPERRVRTEGLVGEEKWVFSF